MTSYQQLNYCEIKCCLITQSVWDNDRGTRHSWNQESTRPWVSRMTSFKVIMALKLKSTKILIYSIWDIKSVLHYTLYMHNANYPIVRSVVLYWLVVRENEWRVETKEKWRVGVKYTLSAQLRSYARLNKSDSIKYNWVDVYLIH